MVRARPVQVLATCATVALLSWGLAAPVSAETPSPTPATPGAGSTTAVPETPGPSATPSATPTAAPTAAPTGTPSSTPSGPARDVDDAPLTLAVHPKGGPVADAFYEDLGSFAFTGTTTLADGSTVTVQRRTTDGWTDVTSAVATSGTYAVAAPVQGAGQATFRASAEGVEGAAVTSTPVEVTVLNSTVDLQAPASVDSLKTLPVSGHVVPARAGVDVKIDVRRGSRWKNVGTATTAADGTWSTALSYGKSRLARYTLRASFRATNRPRWDRSATAASRRVAVLDAVVDGTTKADVAKTYRKGCPVGRSKLSTIRMNYYGRDKRMHRGVMIIRTDLRQEIIRGFGSALKHRYPVAKMKNPNAYGGNDPKQMKANNTSGFNCRKVVGNPYKMSPHSYGIAIDVNTVQNPYRDVNGKWWPSNGKKYRDRTPLRWGMLGKKSWLTKSLRKDHFFWGGLWNPGRDYQHFEYHG